MDSRVFPYHSGLGYCGNKLHAMKSRPVPIMCFHISCARSSSLRNAIACSRLTLQPCWLPSRMRCKSVISAITLSRFLFFFMVFTPLSGSRAAPKVASAARGPVAKHGSKLSDVIPRRCDAKNDRRLLPIMSFRDAEPANLVL